MELLNRCQKANESLQEYATDIERLAHLAYEGYPAEMIEAFKIEASIRGLRDVNTRRGANITTKETFAETLSYALTQETASLLSKPAHNVHRAYLEQNENMEK